jgi:hypothetical protein
MKRKVQSACVEDTDPQTEEPIPSTQNSASISPSAQESYLRRKLWRESGQQHIYECRDSQDLGPVLDMISQSDQEILTIIAGLHDDNAEIWAECEASARKSGKKYRIFYLQGLFLFLPTKRWDCAEKSAPTKTSSLMANPKPTSRVLSSSPPRKISQPLIQA